MQVFHGHGGSVKSVSCRPADRHLSLSLSLSPNLNPNPNPDPNPNPNPTANLPKWPPVHLAGSKPCSQMSAVAAGEVPWK